MAYGTVNADLITDSNGGRLSPVSSVFRNRIINGNMVIDQRNAGASQTFTAAAALAYSVDRWYGYCTGANVTGQQIAGGTTPTVTRNRYKFTGAASVTAVGFGQRIEANNSSDLAGSTCTLSADLASSSLSTVTWTASYANTADTFGSLASPTITQISTGTFTINSTVTNYSVNISVPAPANTGIQVVFTVGALLASATWTIGNVQLEVGSQATSFDVRDYGRELILCQRYYWKLLSTGNSFGFYNGFMANTVLLRGAINFPVSMRTNPTTSLTNPSSTLIINSASNVSSLSLNNAYLDTDGGNVEVVGTTGASTTGYGGMLFDLGTASGAALNFSAEL